MNNQTLRLIVLNFSLLFLPENVKCAKNTHTIVCICKVTSTPEVYNLETRILIVSMASSSSIKEDTFFGNKKYYAGRNCYLYLSEKRAILSQTAVFFSVIKTLGGKTGIICTVCNKHSICH